MADIYQEFGADVKLSAQGDLLPVTGATETQQRVIRRLLTNPGQYLQHPDYGAGLGRFIGDNLSTALFQDIKNICVSQLLLEASVAKNPAPVVTPSIIDTDYGQVLQNRLQYYDVIEQKMVYLTFNVT